MPVAADRGLRYLFFRERDRGLAMETSRLQEIIQPVPMVPVPLSPPFIKGIINVRGRIHTVIDLPLLLGYGTSRHAPSAFVLLGEGDMALAVEAEEISGIETLTSAHLESLTIHEEGEGSLVKAVIRHQGDPVRIVDIQRILNRLREFDGAGERSLS